MLWGYTLRSPHPHARIASIDISRALRATGVHAVLVAADVPGRKTYGLEIADQPVLAIDRVRYQGEPVAVLAANDLELARRATEQITVAYEVLPAVTDMEQALRDNAPRVHDFGNVLRHIRIAHGDPAAAAELWVEGYYETGMQDQAMLGPESGLAIPAEDGGVDLYVATQWLHVDRDQIAPCLGLPPDKVRLHLAGVGGACGPRSPDGQAGTRVAHGSGGTAREECRLDRIRAADRPGDPRERTGPRCDPPLCGDRPAPGAGRT